MDPAAGLPLFFGVPVGMEVHGMVSSWLNLLGVSQLYTGLAAKYVGPAWPGAGVGSSGGGGSGGSGSGSGGRTETWGRLRELKAAVHVSLATGWVAHAQIVRQRDTRSEAAACEPVLSYACSCMRVLGRRMTVAAALSFGGLPGGGGGGGGGGGSGDDGGACGGDGSGDSRTKGDSPPKPRAPSPSGKHKHRNKGGGSGAPPSKQRPSGCAESPAPKAGCGADATRGASSSAGKDGAGAGANLALGFSHTLANKSQLLGRVDVARRKTSLQLACTAKLTESIAVSAAVKVGSRAWSASKFGFAVTVG
jgi:hypothetical protein